VWVWQPKQIWRVFTFNIMLARHYMNVNIMYTYYRLKLILLLCLMPRGIYGCRGNIPYNGLFTTLESSIISLLLQHLYIQVPQAPTEHKLGRMKIRFIRTESRICVLSVNWTLIFHLVDAYFINCFSLFRYLKNNLQDGFHIIFVQSCHL